MPRKFDYLVFVGRLQPFHAGHLAVVREALQQANRLIIIVGSAYQSRSMRNPFTFDERKAMIESCLGIDKWRVHIIPVHDRLYDERQWVIDVQENVTRTILENHDANSHTHYNVGLNDMRLGLIGHNKDESSYYLKLFPEWESIGVKNYKGINATDIRDVYFSNGKIEDVHPEVEKFMKRFMQHGMPYANIVQHNTFIESYKEQWSSSPYPPTFVTVDAVVVQSGNVLMVRRKSHPGKGLWALPGGFLDNKERIQDAVIRELKEETKIKVPIGVLKGSIKRHEVFDHPQRSERGRTITHAFLIDLPESTELPKVKGSDDAEHAEWIPIGNLDGENIFEDHLEIINKLTS